MKEIKVSGKVIKGEERARVLGFPTANIKLKKAIEKGVYSGEAIVDGRKYRAAICVSDIKPMEVHILNFSSDIYGKTIDVIIKEKIREVMKFKDDQALACQIMKDISLITNSHVRHS